MSRERIPARVVPPGRIIQRELEARGWTQIDLAEIMKRPIQAVNEIINKAKQITPVTALELSEAFGTTPEFWLNLETNYRVWLARQERTEGEIARRGKVYSLLRIREMQKLGWLNSTSTTSELEQEVCSFLGIDSLDEPVKMLVNFRCSPGKEPEYPAKAAWLKRVEHLARKKSVASYNAQNLLNGLSDLLALSMRTEDVSRVPAWLSDYGVKCVFVPHLSKTYIDGAAFFMDDNPVVALSLRYSRLDCFWFNLCHELGHLLFGHGQSYLDVDLNSPDESNQEIQNIDEEKVATEKALEWLLNDKEYNAFVQRTRPYFSRSTVMEFSRSQHRHPSIVVGRLQHDNVIPPSNLNQLHAKVTDYLLSYLDA